MNKRPGEVRVTTEVAYCSFCGRPRTLRREERQLGALVRTVITCETCHRTLSSTVGVASVEPVEAAAEKAEVPAEAASAAAPAAAPAPKAAKPSATKRAPKAKAKPKAAPPKKKVPPRPRGKGSR
jgi:hypothetical protein